MTIPARNLNNTHIIHQKYWTKVACTRDIIEGHQSIKNVLPHHTYNAFYGNCDLPAIKKEISQKCFAVQLKCIVNNTDAYNWS